MGQPYNGDFILETENLCKSFKGFAAVDQVNLRVRSGRIHALIGPNGAGKTTCFNLLTRFLEPSAGRIIYKGQDIGEVGPEEMARRGMVRSFQISSVFPKLTALENVRIALQRAEPTSFQFWRSDKVLSHLNARAMDLLDAVGLAPYATKHALELIYSHKRALEIATTLASDPDLILLDEPTQGVGHEDVARVTALIKKVSAGRTVLMVEHNMSVVADISDTITVMQRGAILAEGTYAEISRNPLVMEAYLGTADAASGAVH